MNVLDWSMERQTYRVEWEASLLWETALGIAAATYTEIHPTLEKPAAHWKRLRRTLPASLDARVEEMREHNTWKTLLLLLHQEEFREPGEFLRWMEGLKEEEFRHHALPYLGEEWEEARRRAAAGDGQAVTALVRAAGGNPFFPDYIRYIAGTEMLRLKESLREVFTGWYREVVEPDAEGIRTVLEKDLRSKRERARRLSPEETVEEAAGLICPPEPSVHRVLLIPHIVYRPWAIQAGAPGTRIFYYPVVDASLRGEGDPFAPPSDLVRFHKALGDEKRLRMLKLLREKARTLQELTGEMGLAKTTVHHHLRMLRSARLVEAAGARFQVSERGLARGAGELTGFLDGDLPRG